MWRERLGRQRAQAEATELRLKLSSQLAAVAPAATSTQGAGGGGTDAEPDDALLASLQAEMARNDCLADELTRLKVGEGGACCAGSGGAGMSSTLAAPRAKGRSASCPSRDDRRSLLATPPSWRSAGAPGPPAEPRRAA